MTLVDVHTLMKLSEPECGFEETIKLVLIYFKSLFEIPVIRLPAALGILPHCQAIYSHHGVVPSFYDTRIKGWFHNIFCI